MRECLLCSIRSRAYLALIRTAGGGRSAADPVSNSRLQNVRCSRCLWHISFHFFVFLEIERFCNMRDEMKKIDSAAWGDLHLPNDIATCVFIAFGFCSRLFRCRVQLPRLIVSFGFADL